MGSDQPESPLQRPDASGWLSQAEAAANSMLGRFAQLRLTGVHVTIARGVATLYGTVQSWAEHDLAGFTALRTPGIYRVINNLTVIYQQYSLRTISSVRY